MKLFIGAMLVFSVYSTGCTQEIAEIDHEQSPVREKPAASSPVIRDTDFFGINASIDDLFHQSASWREDMPHLSSFTYEARVKITETSAGTATVGLFFLRDGAGSGFNLNIVPHLDFWKLYDSTTRSFILQGYEKDAFGLDVWYALKVQVTEDRIHIFIDDKRMTPPDGLLRPPGSGIAGLRVRNASACFDNVSLTMPSGDSPAYFEDFSDGDSGWKQDNSSVWTVESDGDDGFYCVDAVPDRDLLMGDELSDRMNAHFDLIQASGAGAVRMFFRWDDVQLGGPDDFYWDYTDSVVIAARNRGLQIVPALVYTPSWAVSSENRADESAYAFPPGNNDDYARFVEATVRRYMPDGELAQEEGWDDGYGITAFEIGHEFNVGKIKLDEKRIFFAGWLGSLDQYVDLLKAGHDAVKQECAECKVLNGAVGDDVPVAYESSRTDPGSSRQTVWQGVEDLYENIQARHPGEQNPADRYFDILNIHTYQWFMLTGQGQLPDIHRDYTFPDRLWYEDRLKNVTEVMSRYGDSDKDIWLTETSYASGDSGDPYAGFLTEEKQAEALRMAFEESAAFPQVKKVFWWYAYDVGYIVGLIRDDMSVKPAFKEYARLAGRP
ncbi:MAG: hypothetical protein HZB44_07475 [Actinobacteria bacterium]|nr:hypothetical protein [Actinomycetota bacterium]